MPGSGEGGFAAAGQQAVNSSGTAAVVAAVADQDVARGCIDLPRPARDSPLRC